MSAPTRESLLAQLANEREERQARRLADLLAVAR